MCGMLRKSFCRILVLRLLLMYFCVRNFWRYGVILRYFDKVLVVRLCVWVCLLVVEKMVEGLKWLKLRWWMMEVREGYLMMVVRNLWKMCE